MKAFLDHIRQAANAFTEINETVRVVSHLDADGICSAAIMINALKNLNYKYVPSIIKQLSEDILIEYAKEDYNVFVFTDLGSGQLKLIKKYLPDKRIFILDHHSFSKINLPKNIINMNPHSFNIDGSIEISGSGVVYLFAEALDKKNKEVAHLAIIGALGDIQGADGFTGLNKYIIDKADKIKIQKSIRWFGIETKPLYYLLTYSSDPFIPGVTGKESGAIQFLQEIGIDPKINYSWRKYNDLSEKEKQKLLSAIIMKRAEEKNPEDILALRYILIDQEVSTPFRDAKEFATLLNACGRMDKASAGIGACLNDENSKKQALKTLATYKKEIVAALNWYHNTDSILQGNRYIIINAKNKVRATIIGTIASIISKSDEFPKGTIIIAMARDNNTSKVSIRAVDSKINLKDLASDISKNIGEAGGHKSAAGAMIPIEHEEKFISNAISSLT